jgi:putative peptidoglycan lipid II flippase
MLRSSLVVGTLSLVGGLTGILVDTSIAAHLGLSKSSDTFFVAFTIPYIITNLLYATSQSALVPFFASLQARHSAEELWRGFSYAVSLILVALGGIALVGALAAPWLVRGIAPGLDPVQTANATQLARWLFLIIVPAGLAEVFRSFLLSHHRFALPSAAGFFRNITVILFILLGFDQYGEYSIVLGYLAGYLVQVSVVGLQLAMTFPVRFSLTLVGSGEAFRNLRGAGTAQLGGAAVWQAVTVVERIIASFLPPGTITALNWGFKIMSTMAELLAGSVGTVALPALSRAVAHRDHEEERRTIRDTLEISLVVVSPAVVFCLLLDQNIMRLVFERGNFTAASTELMARVFFYYSLSLIFFSFFRVLTFYLFARHEAGAFFRLTLLLYGLNVAFDLLYVGALRLGAMGIPLGLLTAYTVTIALGIERNVADLRAALDRAFGLFTLKNLLGAGLAGVAVAVMGNWMERPATGMENFLHLAWVCGAGTLIFFATLMVTRAIPYSRFAESFKTLEKP